MHGVRCAGTRVYSAAEDLPVRFAKGKDKACIDLPKWSAAELSVPPPPAMAPWARCLEAVAAADPKRRLKGCLPPSAYYGIPTPQAGFPG